MNSKEMLGNNIVDSAGDAEPSSTQVWLPKGFSFLSGLPTPARKRRLLMPMQACIDESGIGGVGPAVIFAGYIAPSEVWATFTDEWQAVLDTEPRVSTFKMHEAAHFQGAFSGWSREARDEKLRDLVQVISRQPVVAIHCTMEIAGQAELRDVGKPMNQLYFWPFQVVISAVAYELVDWGMKDKFEIIFDENDIFGPRAKAWYPLIRASTAAVDEHAYSLMPVEPLFRSDDDFLPLQAADMLAWLFRRAWAKPEDDEFHWIAEELQKSIPLSEHSQMVPKERVTYWVSLSKDAFFSKESYRGYRAHQEPRRAGGIPL